MTTNPPSSDDEHIVEESGPLTFARQPTDQQREAGVVACFVHRPGDGEDWVAQGEVSRSPQGLVISRMEIWPGTPGDEPYASVTARILRAVPVGEILTKVTSTAFVIEPLIAEVSYPLTPQTAPDEKPRPGRAPLTDELLREVASQYLEETGPGKPRGAVQRMAERRSKPVPTVSRWLKRAREDGWLGPASQGREGGEPGPRLLAEYAQHPVPERMPDGTISVWVPPKAETEEEAAQLREHMLRAWKSHQAPEAPAE